MTTRRKFMIGSVISAGTLNAIAATAVAPAVDKSKTLDEKAPNAVALGYVADTTKANQVKYPKHAKEQMCSNCALYSGKAGDKSGKCAIFANDLVAAPGWCSAWVKKA